MFSLVSFAHAVPFAWNTLPLLFTSLLRSQPPLTNPPWLGEVILLHDSIHPLHRGEPDEC